MSRQIGGQYSHDRLIHVLKGHWITYRLAELMENNPKKNKTKKRTLTVLKEEAICIGVVVVCFSVFHFPIFS